MYDLSNFYKYNVSILPTFIYMFNVVQGQILTCRRTNNQREIIYSHDRVCYS